WSPDGRFLAFKRDRDPAGMRADLEVWDLASTQRVLHARGRVTLNALSFHPRQPQLMAVRDGGVVSVWDLESARELREVPLCAPPIAVRFCPDGERFAASYEADSDAVLVVHDAQKGAPLLTNICPGGVVNLEWHPEGRWIAAPDLAGNVRLIDPKTGRERTLGQHK